MYSPVSNPLFLSLLPIAQLSSTSTCVSIFPSCCVESDIDHGSSENGLNSNRENSVDNGRRLFDTVGKPVYL